MVLGMEFGMTPLPGRSSRLPMRSGAAAVSFVLFCAALLASGVHASARGGANAAEFLRIGWGGRGPALGDAFTARAEGVAALHYNPAALGRIESAEIEAMYQHLPFDLGHGNLGYAGPLGAGGGWGVGATYLDYGRAARTTISTVGGVNAIDAGSFGGADVAVGVSYGRRLGAAMAWGVTGKVVSSRIENATASAAALDAGLLLAPPGRPYRIGAVARNLGTTIVTGHAI
jgi:hypothetical protein